MEITGEVMDIIYQNETNGYMIATLFCDDLEITIVGYMPFVKPGDNLKVIGKFVVHQEYGRQFKVDTFEILMPKTSAQLEKYLANGMIEGVGPATARKIVKKFGDETLEILKVEPERLAEISGITPARAERIGECFAENWGLWEIVSFLGSLGIEPQSAQAIYKKLGADTIQKVQENPYILEDIGVRVEFSQIDKMALNIGIERNSLLRVGSGIIHGLNLASVNGHCCVLEQNLIKYVTTLLGISESDVKDGIKDLRSKEKINIEEREGEYTIDGKTEIGVQTWIYLADFYKAEVNIVSKINALQASKNMKKIRDLDKMLKDVSKIQLSEKQREAVEVINKNNVSIITGGPGTGKTTIIKVIIDMYKSLAKKVVLCAPTGRAAKRMTEATGEDAKTLHRLLEIGKTSDDKVDIDLGVAPIDADVIIVDEMSMVDLFLMNYLLKGVYKGTKLILVGDSDQLPSVGPGTILKDLIEADEVPCVALNKIFRQAAKSKIIVNSHKVNEGINFIGEVDNGDELDDFDFISETNIKEVQDKILSLYDENTQIITPTKKGDLGTKGLNELIQENFNPKKEYKYEKKFGDVIFREGDKVMQIKNNYDIEWIKNAEDGDVFKREYGSGIFNGEMGTISEIDNDAGCIVIKFEDGKEAVYLYADLEQLVHSYAITVHKSQGSEFDKVIMPILNAPPMLLTRNVLYTGMTRAKKHLTIIGNDKTIEFMINNSKIKERNTGLRYKFEL